MGVASGSKIFTYKDRNQRILIRLWTEDSTIIPEVLAKLDTDVTAEFRWSDSGAKRSAKSGKIDFPMRRLEG